MNQVYCQSRNVLYSAIQLLFKDISHWHARCCEDFKFTKVRAMPDTFTILIADRNRNVREYLRREFVSDGYSVKLAKDGREMISLIQEEPPPDLLIYDLEAPYLNGPDSLGALEDTRPLLPIIVYTFLTEHANHKAVKRAAAFLEKRGNDIDALKAAVAKVLGNCYPSRFVSETTSQKIPT